MTDDAAPREVGSHAGLGLLAEKRREYRTESSVAIWGCLICNNIWIASDGGPVKFLIGSVWLVFAGVLIWLDRSERKA